MWTGHDNQYSTILNFQRIRFEEFYSGSSKWVLFEGEIQYGWRDPTDIKIIPI